MFALLKPHLSTLIEHFIFPLVCLTEDEIEMFNEDPAEYARQFFGGASPRVLKPVISKRERGWLIKTVTENKQTLSPTRTLLRPRPPSPSSPRWSKRAPRLPSSPCCSLSNPSSTSESLSPSYNAIEGAG